LLRVYICVFILFILSMLFRLLLLCLDLPIGIMQHSPLFIDGLLNDCRLTHDEA
jgi:hypothetical protein